MSSPLRQEQQAATRQKLLDAAHACFTENGFLDTTVEQIVRRAGTSRATFYLHFPSKSDALAHTWDELDLPDVEAVMRRFDEGGDFSLAATRAWLDELLTYWQRNANVAVSANQAMAMEPELLGRWVTNLAAVERDLPTMIQRLGGDQAASDRVITLAVQLERTTYFWFNGGLPFDRDRLLDALARQWALG